VMAAVGALLGREYQNYIVDHADRLHLSWAALAIPAGVSAAVAIPNGWDHRTISTEVWVNAPPEKVWPYVLNSSDYPEPKFWLFRLGVAHPVATSTEGNTRICRLSTGDMRERIVRFEPSRRLTFEVLNTPPTVRETNPFGQVDARHNDTRFRCLTGDWQLIPERGGTRIVGTSEYAHRFGANEYWRLWTDEIVHQVHWRVFDHIKEVVEKR